MSKNKAGDYEQKNSKLLCLNAKCGKTDIVFLDTKQIFEDNIGFSWFAKLGRIKTTYVGLYHCRDCNQVSAYPVLYKAETNKISTTKENTQILHST